MKHNKSLIKCTVTFYKASYICKLYVNTQGNNFTVKVVKEIWNMCSSTGSSSQYTWSHLKGGIN